VFFDRLHTEKQFQYAQEWVRLLNLYFAGDTGYIDTLGEACFSAGDCAMAIYNSNLLIKLDPKVFPQPLKTWE
jgi:hypothetical protein